ncbi:MAG TPA: filamentous hemagglutinin N-terminal domain-containing protein, partial [Allocoleopsis sp.]
MQLLEQGGQAKDVGHLGWHRILKFAGDLAIAAIVLLTLSPSVWAQRRPVADGTLGNERSVVTPDTFNGRQGDRIDGGATRGENLFHSFQDFGVDEGRSVYFSNPVGIRNILSRVTGSNVSEILGVLGVLGDANLFLLNPNGIIFGPNAQLDVRGSFLASTGDRFSFADGSEFSAINPQAAPLLNVNISPGLQHGTGRGDLSNAANLAVGAG